MLIFRYLLKEVFTTLVALTAILLLIFMSNQVVIYLNRAASGGIPGMLIMQLMILELPMFLSLLLPFGFYLALLLAYGRLYADQEMTVLQACGYGYPQLLKHSLIMASAVALVTALMVFESPKIAYERASLLQTTGPKTLIQTIMPGRFRALSGGQQVFYVDEMDPEHTHAKHIFIARLLHGKEKPQWDVLWASRAFVATDANGEDAIILEDGKKYQGQPGLADYQIAQFERYQARLPHPVVVVKDDIRTVPFRDLLSWNQHNRQKAAELQWRCSIPLMVFVLTLVAVPLSRVNPRAGKYARLLPAIILYILYANFMFIARDWLAAGKLPLWMGLWWLHLLVASIGIGLGLKRQV
jgi:lipopolysaccharide export system permease protein